MSMSSWSISLCLCESTSLFRMTLCTTPTRSDIGLDLSSVISLDASGDRPPVVYILNPFADVFRTTITVTILTAVHKAAITVKKMYCIALHCIALHCIALHCIALHCIALHCIALHCIALHCIALHCIALHCIALHCIALHCIALHRAVQCSAVQCSAVQCSAVQCSAVQCSAVQFFQIPTGPEDPVTVVISELNNIYIYIYIYIFWSHKNREPPRLRFKDTIKRNLKLRDIKTDSWTSLSQQRNKWRAIVK